MKNSVHTELGVIVCVGGGVTGVIPGASTAGGGGLSTSLLTSTESSEASDELEVLGLLPTLTTSILSFVSSSLRPFLQYFSYGSNSLKNFQCKKLFRT